MPNLKQILKIQKRTNQYIQYGTLLLHHDTLLTYINRPEKSEEDIIKVLQRNDFHETGEENYLFGIPAEKLGEVYEPIGLPMTFGRVELIHWNFRNGRISLGTKPENQYWKIKQYTTQNDLLDEDVLMRPTALCNMVVTYLSMLPKDLFKLIEEIDDVKYQ